jgi:uncharacterized protein (TIGR03435 family)
MDATRLTGKYDYTVFGPRRPLLLRCGERRLPTSPMVRVYFDSVQDQLGLKIERRKRLVQILVVDHVEKKPTEN